ncbi:MAG: phenylacetate-CoA oxygenase subunit PaaJ [Chitinophagales bacterium]|nr:phenylacetate-CoA oxygenase subunit PaaJ [Chitinophagales bacterium]MDW8419296.1 1,2-phenylacetyl-CoA epoxidase subunit PaaD [Chitinophagales bacterium]
METHTKNFTAEEIRSALEQVKDPEIPVLSIVEMGMVSKIDADAEVPVVVLTPTFVGCPALNLIRQSAVEALKERGIHAEVKFDLSDKWTTNRLSPQAKEKLEKFGLAPPPYLSDEELTEEQLNRVRCPHCHSTDTTLRTAFGSTLCRAIRFCFTCRQAFEQFKPVA